MRVEVLIISEDNGREGVATLANVFSRLVRVYDDKNRVVVDIRPRDTTLCVAAPSSVWSARNDESRNKVRLLCGRVATELALGRVVLIHADADEIWSKSRKKIKALRESFDRNVRNVVEQFLAAKNIEQRNVLLKRLLLVIPTWSIEAWTYQSTALAASYCEQSCHGAHVQVFEQWAQDRADTSLVALISNTSCALRSPKRSSLCESASVVSRRRCDRNRRGLGRKQRRRSCPA